MDDETVFGPVLHRLSFGEAIGRKLLSDYQVVVVGVDEDTYRAYAKRGELVTRDGQRITDARALAGQVGLAKTMRKYNLRRIITFHSRVSAASAFSREMPDVVAWMPARARPSGTLWTQHVSGAMTSGHRDRLLLRFRELREEERGLLSNARCLGEGVDVPTLDGIAFIDPRRSTIDIIQAVGRAIRTAEEKKVGTVVLPVFVSSDEDPERLLDESQFKQVWDVLKALRAHDERLGEELDDLRRQVGGGRSGPRRPSKIKLDLPREVGVEFARAFDARLVEQTTTSWEFWYGRLLAFGERHGHSRVPHRYRDDDGQRLGAWTNNERFRRNKRSPEQVLLLEGLPGWSWNLRDSKWEDGYARLVRFAEREGHTRVPGTYRDEDGHALGHWTSTQRQFRRRGELSPDRLERLNALPGWSWDPSTDGWEEGYARLLGYVDRTGHSRVKQRYRDEDSYRLGAWASVQRQQRRQLSRERVRRLESLPGWTWRLDDAKWEEAYERLERFVRQHGHARVRKEHVEEDGFRLGGWAASQRRHRRSLTAERSQRLEALPGWTWHTKDAQWEEAYARLETFIEAEHHSRVPSGYRDQDGYPLGRWVVTQRRFWKNGSFSEDRRRRLERLPGWAWDLKTAQWKDGYARLQRFVDSEGHSRVPLQHQDEDGHGLGIWVTVQRREMKAGRLPAERARRLAALPGWTLDPFADDWEKGFSRLLQFVEQEGHSRVPSGWRSPDGFRLGSWINGQRNSFRKGKVGEDRRRRLEALPGWAWRLTSHGRVPADP